VEMLCCPGCGAEVPSVLHLCAYCGHEWPLGEEPARCPVCGRPPRRVRFCTECGCRLGRQVGCGFSAVPVAGSESNRDGSVVLREGAGSARRLE